MLLVKERLHLFREYKQFAGMQVHVPSSPEMTHENKKARTKTVLFPFLLLSCE